MARMDVIVGVDVADTNTDAVVLSSNGEVLTKVKIPTSYGDLAGSVSRAITNVLNEISGEVRVHRVHIGTTHFQNAVVWQRDLVKVAIIRLCGKATTSLPPFSDFPSDLKGVLTIPEASIHMVKGGFEHNGKTSIEEIDVTEIKPILKVITEAGISNIVVSGVFSPINNTQEEMVADIIKETYPEVSITLTHQIAQLGLLQRENAAILNESLKPLCRQTVDSIHKALDLLSLKCPVYFTQNDGTLLNTEKTLRFPVRTFSTGLTNSIRGAAYLTGMKNAIVVDIGGTTTNVGTLVEGFPKQALFHVKVGQVQTNLRMPEAYCFKLGGGSLIKMGDTKKVIIGPQSLGYKLTTDSLVFGGHTLTTSDIAVAAGLASMGTKPLSATDVPTNLVTDTLNAIHSMLADAIDRNKVCKEPVPVIFVGGGSVIIDECKPIKGASSVIKPKNYDIANAVGAAQSQVSGTADVLCYLEKTSKEEVIESVIQKAINDAVKSGADPNKTKVVDVIEEPQTHLSEKVLKVRVTAIGDLPSILEGHQGIIWQRTDVAEKFIKPDMGDMEPKPSVDDNLHYTPPTINSKGEWELSAYDIEAISIGAGILGSGGGESPYLGKLRCHRALSEGKSIKVVSPERFASTMVPGDRIVTLSEIGAPGSGFEHLPNQDGMKYCFDAIAELIMSPEYNIETGELVTSDSNTKHVKAGTTYVDQYTAPSGVNVHNSKSRVTAVACDEIGGANAMEPLIFAAYNDMLVVDCDTSGRAVPELQMAVPTIYGVKCFPAALADYKGNHTVVTYSDTPKGIEDIFRYKVSKIGSCTPMAMLSFDKDELLEKMVLHSISRAWRLGNAVLDARQQKTNPLSAIIKHQNAKLLCVGKITDVKRVATGGFINGQVTIEGVNEFQGCDLIIDFQNECLLAKMKNKNDEGKEEVLVVTPDLISLMDTEKGDSVFTEELRYGLHVSVLGLPAVPLLKTETALKVVGPQAFDYPKDVKFVPCGDYIEHKPVAPID